MLSINAHFVVSVACVGGVSKEIAADITVSPGLLDNNPEQIRNTLKISAYVLETT